MKRISNPSPAPSVRAPAGDHVGAAEGTLLLHSGSTTEMLLDMLAQPVRRTVLTNDRGHVVGESHHSAKLTDHDVFLILELRAEGVACREIAGKFDVSLSTIKSISCGRRRAQTATGQKQAVYGVRT